MLMYSYGQLLIDCYGRLCTAMDNYGQSWQAKDAINSVDYGCIPMTLILSIRYTVYFICYFILYFSLLEINGKHVHINIVGLRNFCNNHHIQKTTRVRSVWLHAANHCEICFCAVRRGENEIVEFFSLKGVDQINDFLFKRPFFIFCLFLVFS